MRKHILEVYTPFEKADTLIKSEIIEFLSRHLDEFGDDREAIGKAIDYAMKDRISPGGFVLLSREGREITGAVVINQTGMESYIPENILVYIAVHREHRGKGLGKKLMQQAIDLSKGDIALHVEPNNPALYLYEKLGFENKYLEMRLSK